MEIVYKDKNVVVINKPSGIPSQSDKGGDADALSLTSAELAELNEPSELWLVHRLDRVVGGLLLFARNKRAAATLSELFKEGRVLKEYLTVAEGYLDKGEMQDYLYKDTLFSKSFVVDRKRKGVKEAHLEYEALSHTLTDKGERTLVRVRLGTGRFHQIRTQFSSRGHAILGDGKYGSREKCKNIALMSHRLAVSQGEIGFDLRLSPDYSKYPWSLFKGGEEK